MTKKPFVSVQIINWNGLRFLKDCFDSLLKQDYPNLELVLVDNGSRDESISFMKSTYHHEIKNNRIRIDVLGNNYGFAEGYNRSYALTEADYVLLINNDTICPDARLVSKMVSAAEKNSNVALVGASIYPFGTDLKKVKKIEKPGTLSLALTNTLRHLKGNKVFYVSGCCCLIKKKLIDKPFDNDYFTYCEDVYLGWKSILKGHSNIQVPNAKILHFGSGTTGSGSPFVRYYAERNRMLNCFIFYKWTTLIRVLPLLILYSLTAGIFFLQRPKVFWSFLKGHFWILTHPLLILKKRREIQRIRVINDKEILGVLSSEIFLMQTKMTSFNESFKEKKFIVRFIDFTAKILNKFSKGYCYLVGLKTIDRNDKN